MKKFALAFVLAVVSIFVLACCAVAAKPMRVIKAPYYTVQEIKTLADDTPIVIRGYIVEKLPSGKYLVKDVSSFVEVEIDTNNYYYKRAPEKLVREGFADDENRTHGEIRKMKTIVDPDVRVEIVGTVVAARGSDTVVHADSVTRIK